MMMTLPHLLFEAFCDKVPNVGDVFVCGFPFLKYSLRGCIGDVYVCGFSFPKTFTKECVFLMEYPIKYVVYIQYYIIMVVLIHC